MAEKGASAKIELTEAKLATDMSAVRELFIEYAKWLGFSLAYQNFQGELASLPGKYANPRGRLLLARVDGEAAGCGAMRPLDDSTCEMKRLFVRPSFRGLGLGRKIAEELIASAREVGYDAMRLDTLPDKMGEAVRMYWSLGFYEISAYYANAPAGTVYFETRLDRPRT